jgi:hypothetical protein
MSKLTVTGVTFCVMAVAVQAQTLRAPFDLSANFAATGWMGEGSKGTMLVRIDEQYTQHRRANDDDGKCIRISWQPSTAEWVGLYWQSPAGNWGVQPGRSIEGASKIVFWASGQNGGEVVEFKAGGIRAQGMPYKDSFEAGLGAVRLTNSWRLYQINLTGRNLTSVIGGFGWTARKSANAGTMVFYLDGIRYE